MKIRILIKENFDKIYNILEIIQNNTFLSENIKNVEYFNENNWSKVFDKVVKEIKDEKKFERLCIFDLDGILPFIFFSKIKGFIAACPDNVEKAKLARAHNNANCIIMPLKYVEHNNINKILDAFFTTDAEGGRHAVRVKLMQEPFKDTNKIFAFNKNAKETVVICSDHAGFNLKNDIIKYLTNTKRMKVIDVGCFGPESTHYPLFAIAMILNANKARYGIAVCSTGAGIANTTNKFKGINTFICTTPDIAKIAISKYDMNVLALPANFIDKKQITSIIDSYLNTPCGSNKFMHDMNNYGYEFDKEAFNKIEIANNIVIPKELK